MAYDYTLDLSTNLAVGKDHNTPDKKVGLLSSEANLSTKLENTQVPQLFVRVLK